MTTDPSNNPIFQSPDGSSTEAQRALEMEARLPMTGWQQEVSQGLEYGLEAAESIRDRTIPTFSRGELPHYAGINTFLKAPYIEDVRQVGEFDVAIVGIPHDSGTTYRPGTRFGPQGIRRISALYTPYNFEMGIDLRESITLCDVGDVFTIPANNEKFRSDLQGRGPRVCRRGLPDFAGGRPFDRLSHGAGHLPPPG
jgi:agmatinase